MQQWNPEPYDAAIRSLWSMTKHKQETNSPRTDSLFYELLAQHHEKVRNAREEGKLLAVVSPGIPVEILYAFDVVPLNLWWDSNTVVAANNFQSEAFSEAQRYGLPPEICSSHRGVVGAHLKRWVPPPNFVIWCGQTCANTCDTPEMIRHIWNVPGLFLDRPWLGRDEDVIYHAGELRELITFLEKATGKVLDLDHLRERMKIAWTTYQLQQEVCQLKKAMPSPSFNRRVVQFYNINRLYMGTAGAVEYSRAIRDEMKRAIETGAGMPPREKIRLINLGGNFPAHDRRLADWMQKERGACIVADSPESHWGPWEPDFSKPLESLVRKYYADPDTYTSMGPLDRTVRIYLEDATHAHVQAGLFMVSGGCIQNSAKIRTVVDALREQLGLRTLVLNVDVFDPSVVTMAELKDKLEAFFETIEDSE